MINESIFEMPPQKYALPPEMSGRERDSVNLLRISSSEGTYSSWKFSDLPGLLPENAVLVFNNSMMIPSSFMAFSQEIDQYSRLNIGYGNNELLVEVRNRSIKPYEGLRFRFVDGSEIILKETHKNFARYWHAEIPVRFERLRDHTGEFISYSNEIHPLQAKYFMNVFSEIPGSVEYPSAQRPFTESMLSRIESLGIRTEKITLHCNLGSLDASEFWRNNELLPERYSVGRTTAETLNRHIEHGRPVIAVGTTVVRALESSFTNRKFNGSSGFTTKFIEGELESPLSGIITGMHDPSTSHLLMLRAFAPIELIRASYDTAVELGYGWHEFGDSSLILK